MSRKHLARYLAEFDYRYSTRKISDTVRFLAMIDRCDGIRLAYKPLAA